MKFLHAADLHIDSPLVGLENYPGAPTDRLREATFDAFGNLVRLAIEERVDFVLLAGDLFDGDWRDMQTGLKTNLLLRQLTESGIRVFIIRGNHDAASQIEKELDWPEGVHEFRSDTPTTVLIDELDVAIHGWSFPKREVFDNPLVNFPKRVEGRLNIGLLHTGLEGSSEHARYAPTSVDRLAALGYDYWALGHIHHREIVSKSPYIVFSGNTQGRHIRETGEKGVYLVEASGGVIESVTFHPTDILRWHLVEISMSEDDLEEDLLEKLDEKMDQLLDLNGGKFCAIRLLIHGYCRAHQSWSDQNGRDSTLNKIHDMANSRSDQFWIEKIIFKTSEPIDYDALRTSDDLLGELVRRVDDLTDQENRSELDRMAEQLRPLSEAVSRSTGGAKIGLFEQSKINDWLIDAQSLLASRLLEESD
jgi:DNA repair exonuclease SbcCD nuclease subunit